jgi:hypothetical protein
MQSQKQLASVIDQILTADSSAKLEESTVDEYKKLNDKCDQVIGKIKSRKDKKNNKQAGD